MGDGGRANAPPATPSASIEDSSDEREENIAPVEVSATFIEM